jgi:fumarate reductase subunit C
MAIARIDLRNDVLKAPPGGDEAVAAAGVHPRVYKPEMPRGWWLRRRHYFLYMLREFTAVPMALWLLWLLFEIHRAANGPKGYYPPASPAFIVFSVICLGFALYHSVTFLSLAGVIMRIKIAGKHVPPRTIVAGMFGLWIVASVVIAAVLIGLAR